MCKKYFKVIITLLLLVEFTFVFLSIKSFNNKDIAKIKEENKVNKEMFSMYVENKDGDYVEYTDSEYYPIGLKYYFNEERSNCTDNKGKVVNNVISYNNNKITVSSNKTLFCYLYFDLDKIPPQTFTFYLGGNTNPEYITSTSTTAYLSWTDTDIESYCINIENNSSSCSWVSTSGNSITPSYTIRTQGSQTRYAFIRDAAENISPVVSDSVFLDSVSPVITSASDSGAGTANVVVTETGSGVTHVCVNTSSSSTTGCVWDEVSGTTFTSTTAVTATGNYYIHVKDKAGNIGHRTSAINIAKPMPNLYKLCSPYTNIGTCMASEYGSTKMQEIANIGSDAGMYRYQGTYDVVDNNYICFGTNNKSTCTGDTNTYMYRIIGINSIGQMKLIKISSIGSYAWHNSASGNVLWADSDIYKGLNAISGGAYNNLFVNNDNYSYMNESSDWYNKISDKNWLYGTISLSAVLTNGPSIYAEEESFTKSIDAKIALPYLSDSDYSWGSGGNPGSIDILANAWIPNFVNGFTITNWYYKANYGITVDGRRGDSWTYVTRVYDVHPVFYLISDIEIMGGIGTSTDPYIIN